MADKKKASTIAPKQEQPAPATPAVQPPPVSQTSPAPQASPKDAPSGASQRDAPSGASRSSSGNCCLIAGITGCGCFIVIIITLVIIGIIGARVAKGVAEGTIKSTSQTTTGVPMPLINILDRFIGRNADGQKFIQFLKEGVPPEGFSGPSGVELPVGGDALFPKQNNNPNEGNGSTPETDPTPPPDYSE